MIELAPISCEGLSGAPARDGQADDVSRGAIDMQAERGGRPVAAPSIRAPLATASSSRTAP